MLQRVFLALGLAVGGALWSQGAAAQAVAPAAPPSGATDVDHSEPAPRGNGGPKVLIDVNLTTQRMHVHFPDGTNAVWPISSGRPGLATPDGKYKPQWIDPTHFSKQYDNAPMPFAIFFDLKGHAIHGSYQKYFGRAISHGCVRLPVADAKKLFAAVKVSNADIIIHGHAPSGGGTLWAQRQASPPPYGSGPQYGDAGPYGYANGTYGYDRAPNRGYPPPPPPSDEGPLQAIFGGLFGN